MERLLDRICTLFRADDHPQMYAEKLRTDLRAIILEEVGAISNRNQTMKISEVWGQCPTCRSTDVIHDQDTPDTAKCWGCGGIFSEDGKTQREGR
jgi:hypothetical protein